MKKKLVGIFVVTLLLVATGLTVAGTLKLNTNSPNGGEGATGWGKYNPAGAWMRSDYELMGQIIPVGVGRYTMISEYLHAPTCFGMFPDAVESTLERGDMVWTGWNTYDFTFFEYGVNIDYEVEYYIITSGTLKMTSSDTADAVMCISIFSGNQDPFSDTPLLCFPFETTYERIPIVPPCEP